MQYLFSKFKYIKSLYSQETISIRTIVDHLNAFAQGSFMALAKESKESAINTSNKIRQYLNTS